MIPQFKARIKNYLKNKNGIWLKAILKRIQKFYQKIKLTKMILKVINMIFMNNKINQA